MNILLLGSGGRENAIAWAIKKNKKVNTLFIAPGNYGTSLLGRNINLDISNFESIKEFIIKEKIDLLIVGPEKPIVDGVFDYLRSVFTLEAYKTPVLEPLHKTSTVLKSSISATVTLLVMIVS